MHIAANDAPFTRLIISSCERYDVSAEVLMDMIIPQLWKEICHLHQEHWDTKQNSENLQSEW